MKREVSEEDKVANGLPQELNLSTSTVRMAAIWENVIIKLYPQLAQMHALLYYYGIGGFP